MAKIQPKSLAESLRDTIDNHPNAGYDEIIASLLFILLGLVVSTSKNKNDAIKYLNHLHKGLKDKISAMPPLFFNQLSRNKEK